MSTMIACRTLGPVEFFSVEAGEQVDLKGHKNRALLLYLARSPSRSRSREHLVGLLWAEKPEEKARHSLREAVRMLRQLLGEDGLESKSDQIGLPENAVRLDIDDFEELEAAGDWAGACNLVTGEFLEGLTVKEAWAFEEWLTGERTLWRGRSIRVLTRRCDELLAAGRAREAVAMALQANTLDPASGTAVRALMKSLALSGERAEALERYELHLKCLKEIGTEPDAETLALFERVRQERLWRLPANVPTGHERGAESRRAPLFGRGEELSKLVATWETCVADRSAAVGIIGGDSGTGKTRLAAELTGRARLSGAAVATFRAVEADLTSPGTGLVGLAGSGLLEGGGLAAASSRALGAFSEHIAEWADRFGVPAGDNLPLEKAIVEVVRAIAEEQPVFLSVDDAQWIDRDTLTALIAAVRDLETSPFYVCFSFAPLPARDELDDLRSRVGREVNGIALRLDKLQDSALRELTEWAMPGYNEDDVDRLTRRVSVDTAGLPLLAVELLHAVALGLDLDQTSEAWPRPLRTLSQTLPGDLPDAIIGAIRVGFRRLSGSAQDALVVAAVVDNPTSAERLGRGAGLEGNTLDAALDELEWQRWLIADKRGYSCVARIVREVIARDMVTEGQKQRIFERLSR